jgi:hypothetical protein
MEKGLEADGTTRNARNLGTSNEDLEWKARGKLRMLERKT